MPNVAQIEARVRAIAENPPVVSELVFELLLAYDLPKATIARLRQAGGINLSKNADEVHLKTKVFFKTALETDDLEALFEAVRQKFLNQKTAPPRFLIVSDGRRVRAFDTKLSDVLAAEIAELHERFDFFLPLAGMEKAVYQGENPADVKAAEKMGKLFDQITRENPTETADQKHALNVFLSRLLFCFFAEDTKIFPEDDQFTLAVKSHTQPDGSDLAGYLDRLFEAMDTPENVRDGMPKYLAAFPYVNGGLFRNRFSAPKFGEKSRRLLLECGELVWKDINPDIFGSMIQAVVDAEKRGGLGMHYTSVPNIMKVIGPLFLDELIDEFVAARFEPRRLRALLERISKIRVFDPACGSGNFLIIAYKELRLLENRILEQLRELQKSASGFDEVGQLSFIPKAQLSLAAAYQTELFSRISLDHFFGIEIDDFAHEIATLSLWLAEHQMNQIFEAQFGQTKPALPLLDAGNILHANATRADWAAHCPPPTDGGEVFVLGNPPYLGYSVQKKDQKEDIAFVFAGTDSAKTLDFIACWFFLGAKYVQNSSAKFAFVTTNSICQGEQVAALWPLIFSKNVEIEFAYKGFKWANSAKFNAGVTVTVVGVRPISKGDKFILGEIKHKVFNISPYLIESKNVIVEKRNVPLSEIPQITRGSSPVDGGNLVLNVDERKLLVEKYPEASVLIKKLVGSDDFINGIDRFCIWIEKQQVDMALRIPVIQNRIELVAKMRLKSPKKATQQQANSPCFFGEIRHKQSNFIIIPRVSSEVRNYIPMGFLGRETVITDLAFGIYDAETWLFSVVTSRMHMTWVRAVCGSLETRIRYSSTLGYNTFPLPPLTETQKSLLKTHALEVLKARESHSEKTLADIYDPEKMPENLRRAHAELDAAVDGCYRSRPFESDEARLEHLFKLYEQMIEDEKTRGTLFAAEGKPKKKPSKKS